LNTHWSARLCWSSKCPVVSSEVRWVEYTLVSSSMLVKCPVVSSEVRWVECTLVRSSVLVECPVVSSEVRWVVYTLANTAVLQRDVFSGQCGI